MDALAFVEKFILPIAIAVITYLLFKKHDEYIQRRQYSILGIAVMESLLEEVKNGIDIMNNLQSAALPVKSWDGTRTVSDDVLLRIIAVSEYIRPAAFPPREIRIHCKNYFEHMSTNWESAIKQGQAAMQNLVNNGQYVRAAEGVKTMLLECKNLLEENSKKPFPQ